MRRRFNLILLVISLIICSCSNNNRNIEETATQNQTPVSLDEGKIESDLSYISKRDESDIIQKLFNEAMSKDSVLKNLNDRINEVNHLKYDSLEAYNNYINNNNSYWSGVDSYINQLNDSALQREMKDVFQILESKYKNRIFQHDLAIDKLEAKAKKLDDCEILMKLIVTEPMMINYQRNELPDIKSLNNLINVYDNLIKKSEPFIKIK